jgi:hypothetical protein
MLKIVGDRAEPWSTPLAIGNWFSGIILSPNCVLLSLYISFRYLIRYFPFISEIFCSCIFYCIFYRVILWSIESNAFSKSINRAYPFSFVASFLDLRSFAIFVKSFMCYYVFCFVLKPFYLSFRNESLFNFASINFSNNFTIMEFT